MSHTTVHSEGRTCAKSQHFNVKVKVRHFKVNFQLKYINRVFIGVMLIYRSSHRIEEQLYH